MKPVIYILWDASHIWGLMALHTLQAMRVPYTLITAKDITHGLLLRKPPAMLLVPGGTASIKSKALGVKGRAAICDYVAAGGKYFGFCGGAGLGLSDKDGLGLCPWKRASYPNRIYHLVSGHVISKLLVHELTTTKLGDSASLPVWWPGFFEADYTKDVNVLATYTHPDVDLCLADIVLDTLPKHMQEHWQELYGVNISVDFIYEHPCVVCGDYGKGQYVLSYAHLETPDSKDANTLMAHIIRTLTGIDVVNELSPKWDLACMPRLLEQNELTMPLYEAFELINNLMTLGCNHRLLFMRNTWLHGWRMGIPGGALNNLYTSLATIISLPLNEPAKKFWQEKREQFTKNMHTFWQAAEGYLLAERLATTLSHQLPGVINKHMLSEQRQMLFGKPMHAGGLYQEILDVADELIFLLGQNS